MAKNCDLGLGKAPLGLQPQAAFSRPQSQFFATRTSQLENNIYHFEQLWYILMQKHGILTLTNEKLKHADFASECRKSRFRGLKIPKFLQGSQTGALPSEAPLIRPHFVKTCIAPENVYLSEHETTDHITVVCLVT